MAFKIKKSEYLHKDEDVSKALLAEIDRLNNSVELIASENVVSGAVLEASGSIFTNKYAEGYPHARYYGGCVNVDSVEDLAKERLSKLFGCEEKGYVVNVQPHSGSQANMAVYIAMLQPGDTVLGMDLSAGGHLTHGCKVNFSGKLYNFVSYTVDDTGRIDYEALATLAIQEKPKMIVAGASAYPRVIDFDKLREIADSCGALLMVDIAHIAGLVAAGVHPSPLGTADFVTSTTHKTLRGPRGGIIISKEAYGRKINSAIFPGIQGGPLMHIIAAKAVAFGEALTPEFTTYQTKIVENAKAMSEVLMNEGVDLVSGGTDNHLMLLDLRSLGITGKDAEAALEEVGITTNKNGIPNDPQPPKITSGIRIGTPAITTRGFGVEECKVIAKIIATVLKNKDSEDVRQKASEDILKLCKKFPVYEVE